MDAAELPQDLVFVDLETTGGNAAYHRITEVGIVRMHDGVVIEEWNSLVNPECPIPAYIAAFTGITDDDGGGGAALRGHRVPGVGKAAGAGVRGA
jgi:DNA polymerase III epsilon subunit-like protein